MQNQPIYEVFAKYRDGANVTHYYLRTLDNRVIKSDRLNTIMLINKGRISNMRLDKYPDGEPLIRGKGINLNNIPCYDKEHPITGTNIVQYKIIGRLMHQNYFVGYLAEDANHNKKKLDIKRANELASQGLILDYHLERYNNGSQIKYRIASNSGIKLEDLPPIMVDKNGGIVNQKTNDSVLVRLTQVKKPGILYNNNARTQSSFDSGDYIVCLKNGELGVLYRQNSLGKIALSNDKNVLGDAYLSNALHYDIEFLGADRKQITPNMVIKWRPCKITK